MNFRLAGPALRSLASTAIALFAIPQIVAAHEDERYVDRNYGFSFSKPHFPPSDEKDVAIVAITLAGAPNGAFAPNLNVIIQNVDTDLDAFAQLQREQLKSLGWEVIDHSRKQIGGLPALRTHARGSLHGVEVEFLSVTLIRDQEKAYVLTCTATRAQFPLYEAEFDRVASSLALGP